MGLTQKLGTIPLAIQTDSSNNVGIGGAANASYKLAVTGASLFTGAGSFSSSVGIGATAGTNGLFEVSNLGAGVSVGDFLVDAANKNVYVGRLSSTSNDNTNFIVRNRIGTAALYVQGNTGNVGIGTSSPDNTYQGLTIYGTNPSLRLKSSATGSWNWIEFVNSSNVNNFSMGVSQSTPIFVIKAGAGLDSPNFAMNSTGNAMIGTTTSTSNAGLTIAPVNGNSDGTISIRGNNASGSNASLYLEAPGIVGGGIYLNRATSTVRVWCASSDIGVQLSNNATSWGSYSDERLKDIIEPISEGLNKVNTLRAVIGKYKTDEEDKRRVFLIAQDVQKVLPEAVFDDRSEDKILSLQYTDIIPLLVNAVQELSAKVTALENK